MRWVLTAVVLGVLVAEVAQTAAPPVPYRPLTAEERQQVAALTRRLNEQSDREAFEEVERLARRILALHERVQGKRHWQTVDARLLVERRQRLRQVPLAQRGEVVRSLHLAGKAQALRARTRYREAEQVDRQALAI